MNANYQQDLRATERQLECLFHERGSAVIVAITTGHMSQATFAVAAPFVLRGSHRPASASEIEQFSHDQQLRRHADCMDEVSRIRMMLRGKE